MAAKSKPTGAASSASFAIESVEAITTLYHDFCTRLQPVGENTERFMVEEAIPYMVRTWKGRSLDFDFVTQLTFKPGRRAVEALKAKGLPESAADKIVAEGMALTAKIDKVGIGDPEVDFGGSPSLVGALDDLQNSREVLVTIKDLFQLFDGERLDSPKVDRPKSFEIKNVMASLARRLGNRPDRRTLFLETLRKTKSAFESKFLPHHYDGRINLLADLDDAKRAAAVRKVDVVLYRHEAMLDRCASRPMVLSQFGSGLLKVNARIRV